MIIIDPSKVVEYQGQILAQLGKLVGASMRHWQAAPAEVRDELGNACALMNKLVRNEQHETESGNIKGGDDGGSAAGESGGGRDGTVTVEQAIPAGVALERSPRVRQSRRLTG